MAFPRRKALRLFLLVSCMGCSILLMLMSPRGSGAKSEAKRLVAEIVRTVRRFHEALAAGDSVAATTLLSKDIIVLEGGRAETAEEYLSHHLSADMEFSAEVRSEHKVLKVDVEGGVAWIVSSSLSEGTFQGREISLLGAELMVLAKEENAWKIQAIHWSSRKK